MSSFTVRCPLAFGSMILLGLLTLLFGCKKSEVSSNALATDADSAKPAAASESRTMDLSETPPPTTRPDDPQRVAAIVAPLKANPRGPTTSLSVDSLPPELAAQAEYEIGRLAAYDPDPAVRHRAMNTLDSLSRGVMPPQLVPLMMKVLQRKDSSDSLGCIYAIGVLKHMGSAAKPAIPLLTDLTDHGPSVDIREGAAEAVVEISFDGRFTPGPGSSEFGRKLVGTWRGGRGETDQMTLTLAEDGRLFLSSEGRGGGKSPVDQQWMVSGSRLVFLGRENQEARFTTGPSLEVVKPQPIKPTALWHILTVNANVMVVEGDSPITFQRVVAR